MKYQLFSFSVLSALLVQVFGHGQVMQVTIDGKDFLGTVPGQTGNPSIIRLVNTGDPIKTAHNPDLNCGTGAQPALDVADANPGSVLEVKWTDEDGQGPWFHDIGPMLTYLASCGDVSCDQFNTNNASWFKIQQDGKTSNGDWVQADLTTGKPAKVTLPSNLAAGSYIMRHEIIALHLGNTEVDPVTLQGGAEFYVSCSQLKVGGSQNGKPLASELVKLPGAYSDTDPGIFDPTIFDPGASYIFPGPPIASFVSGSTPNTAPSSSSKAPVTSSSSKTCMKSTSSAVYPRRLSRIMRALRFEIYGRP
ncbi:glycoside hydrolase family 61 protein [Mycena floridula]|nr:glycoside hydrolase family 61 protein [Mycena floridula]